MLANKAENLSFGKYRLVAELGSGGMGDVFLAMAQGPKGFNKLQVIKRLRPDLAEDEEFLAMFLNEARLAARLNHPNVVQTNEVGEQDGTHFIAMEYLEGQSLHAAIRRGQGKFPLDMHLRVIAEACAGLHHAHEILDFDGTPLSIVHRDCSPQNVFITYDGGVKVLDFGIAKAADSATVTRTGVLKGKVPYMAPEQLEGHDVDRRADIFAVGAMLWEAAAGTRLWKGLNDVQIAHRVHIGDVPSPRAANPDVNDRLEAICLRCLDMDPMERYPTAAALQHELEELIPELGGATTRDVGKWVAQAFVETRRQLRSRIEQELKEVLPARASNSEIPLWQSGERSANRSGEHAAASAVESRSPAATPSISATSEELTTQATAPAISSLPSSEDSGRRSAFPEQPASQGRSGRVIALLGGAVAVAVVVGIVAVRGRETPPAAAQATGGHPTIGAQEKPTTIASASNLSGPAPATEAPDAGPKDGGDKSEGKPGAVKPAPKPVADPAPPPSPPAPSTSVKKQQLDKGSPWD